MLEQIAVGVEMYETYQLQEVLGNHLEAGNLPVAGIQLLLQLPVARLQGLDGRGLVHAGLDSPGQLRVEGCEA